MLVAGSPEAATEGVALHRGGVQAAGWSSRLGEGKSRPVALRENAVGRRVMGVVREGKIRQIEVVVRGRERTSAGGGCAAFREA